jgi:hypothetical protein
LQTENREIYTKSRKLVWQLRPDWVMMMAQLIEAQVRDIFQDFT